MSDLKAAKSSGGSKPAGSRKGRGSGMSGRSGGRGDTAPSSQKPKRPPAKRTASRRKPGKRKSAQAGSVTGRRILFKLLRIGAFAAAFGVFWCGYLLWHISNYDHPRELEPADVGIVLGAALWNNVPSPGLGERLDLAIRLYEEERFDALIVSGGLDNNGSTITEAQGMRNYLVDHGIPPGAIVMEPEATSTYENLLHSRTIMETKGWSSAVIISHDYHSARAHNIAAYLRMEPFQVAGTKSRYISYAESELREVLAYTKWQMDKLARLAGIKEH
ncbi:YdcF family protein [Paenibacillus sp. 1P07SE]|uniref:YdcF family protein n=1 Tax=Paenibacillus sp. 1P07SE TaxID=3132209 RepID=UPI0039A42910